MLGKERVKRHLKRCSFCLGGLILVTGLIVLAALYIPPFGTLYARASRAVSGLLGWLFSFVPFSVAEWLLIALFSTSVIYLIRAAAHSVWVKNCWGLLRWLADFSFTIIGGFCIIISMWGCNYFLPKVDVKMGLSVTERPPEALHDTARWLVAQLQDTYDKVPRYKSSSGGSSDEKPEGVMDAGGFFGLRGESVASIQKLQEQYPEIFGGSIISAPKYITSSNVMAYTYISGIYVPITGECNVNTVTTDSGMPHTMNHEMAHRLGCAPEQDANFVAYLSCMGSDDPSFRYSGALEAFMYCYNAIEDGKIREELLASLPAAVLLDLDYADAVWRPYGEAEIPFIDVPVSEVSLAVNDGYLTVMQQPDGIKSYGRVVDLLIAYYIEQAGNPS